MAITSSLTVRLIEQVVASASLQTEDILKSGTQKSDGATY
jgi:hypothetical protein